LEEFAIAVDEPGEQDVDRIRINRAAAAGLVRAAVKRAFLDLEVASAGVFLARRRFAVPAGVGLLSARHVGD
jgi:hypothetical protein